MVCQPLPSTRFLDRSVKPSVFFPNSAAGAVETEENGGFSRNPGVAVFLLVFCRLSEGREDGDSVDTGFPTSSAFRGSSDALGSYLELSSFSCVTFSWSWLIF